MPLSPSTPTIEPPLSGEPRHEGSAVAVGSSRFASRLLRQNTISDVYDLGLQVDKLLRRGLSDTTLKLNRDLIGRLRAAFDHWLIMTRKELLAQIKKVPKHARERWLKERLENSGLSIQWFSDLGVVDSAPIDPQANIQSVDDGKSPAAAADERRLDQQGLRLLVDFLLHYSRSLVNRLVRLKSGNQDFRRNMAAANSQGEREQVILRYAEQLGASRRNLRRDQVAMGRWFDEEAVNDRFLRQLGQGELLLSFVMDRLGVVLEEMFELVRSGNPSVGNLKQLFERLGIEDRVFAVWNHDGDPRIHTAALECLHRVIKTLPSDRAGEFLGQRFVADLNRAAFKGNLEVWVQCRAIDVLVDLQPDEAASLLTRRLKRIRGGDDIFVRRYVLKKLERRFRMGLDADLELPPAENEPSEFVRQQFARSAFLSNHEANHRQWSRLARHDKVPQVRAAAILVAAELHGDASRRFDALECITSAITEETDPFVARVAFHAACMVLRETYQKAQPDHLRQVNEYYRQRVLPAIGKRITSSESIPVRRHAVHARERIWVTMDQAARELLETIEQPLREIPIGRTKRFRPDLFQGLDDQTLGRILATVAIDDFGFDVHRKRWGVYVTRGPMFGFRIWRCLYEATHSATDKRQALRHTVGRINAAPLRIASQICGELSETKVPGEPLTIASDGTWRPFLPLPDDFIAVLNQSWFHAKTVRFVTAQGITSVTAPRRFFRRLVSATRLNLRFADIARTRNWDDDSFPASTYVQSLGELGFRVEFEPYSEEQSEGDDDSVRQFFDHKPSSDHRSLLARITGSLGRMLTRSKDARPDSPNHQGRRRQSESSRSPNEITHAPTKCGNVDDRYAQTPLALGVLADSSFASSGLTESAEEWFQRFQDYFSAAFENTLEHLLLFTAGVIAIVVAKHFWSNIQLRRARQRIPLSIGGWGTRGKSGTERLKAALIGAMGYGLVSKTTGCEAMFIHADPYSDPLEIPLFRPFDKATIWEQSNLLRTVARMNPSVFLWECMGLTPSYVDVLQRQWTCDDLATITNTYPDHEDLQGPAGHNVATTIAGFVPEGSRMISTEEQMRPYVTESCREAKTSFRGVGWLESGLVTPDVLKRFPYKEHPDNVALVVAMGEELGIEHDVAVKAMGDYLVPDLGVLKTHPATQVRTRKIEFTNGMSANERFGCMGNWNRLGFDRQDPWDHATTWVSGVVNNRADRVSRSKVFAKIMVEDMKADRFFLIGNNLEGLRGFIEDAWFDRSETLTLRDSSHGNRWDRLYALETLKNAAREFRQVIDREQLKKRLSTSVHAALKWSGGDYASVLDKMESLMDDVDAMTMTMTNAGVASSLVGSIARHQHEWLTSIREYEQVQRRIREGDEADVERIETEYKMLLRLWFSRKIVTVPDYDATGEEVVSILVDETPPGFTNRAIGLQNIKGTGLDFVYRFQDWDTCHEACMQALCAQTSVATRGLETLVAMPAIGQLCEETIWSVVNQARQSQTLLRPDLQTMIQTLENRLKRLATSSETRMGSAASENLDAATETTPQQKVRSAQRAKWNEWLIRYGEEFLDLTDSLKRRKKADLVYKDLAEGRIGRQRAISVLRSINKRQKGGWLVK